MSPTELLLLWLYLILVITKSNDSCLDDTCNYCLDQTDFDDDTVRITQPGKYCLSEDIIFNPNHGLSTNPKEPTFFAAMMIETDNVEIDLKNYAISQHKSFYIQQGFYTNIQIGNDIINVANIYIHDGVLGLSSYSSIQSIHGENIKIENIRICDFNFAAIKIDGFDGLSLKNLIIGPSATEIKLSGYYTMGRYSSYALYKLLNAGGSNMESESITFNGERTLNLKEIYENLIMSLDIGYRSFLDETTSDDLNHELYDISIDLYSNPLQLPSYSALYGILLDGMGQNVIISNVKIQDLKMNNNEIPAAYFDLCLNEEINDKTILKGPFGKIMDLRMMVGGFENGINIDLGDDLNGLQYVGNPLSDANIALGLYGKQYDVLYGSQIQNDAFLQWVLNEYNGISSNNLPECISFICNTDIDGNPNKGIFGIHLQEIKNVTIENIMIKRLINKSPLSSYACSNDSNYDGKGSDIKGISINGSDVIFDGFNNVIEKLISYNGAVIGLNVENDAEIMFDYVYKNQVPTKDDDIDTEDDRSSLQIHELCPGHEITFSLLAELMVDGKYPSPNKFFACNILINDKDSSSFIPYPPNGIDNVWCADYVPKDTNHIIGDLLPVHVKYDGNGKEKEYETTTTSMSTESVFGADIISNIDKDKNKLNGIGINRKHTNSPYIFFVIGLFCIIMVVLILVIFLMKCGKYVNAQNSIYKKAKYHDSDDETDIIEDDNDNIESKQNV